MKSFAIIAASLPFITASFDDAAACRNLPGDAGWPSEADWKAQLPGSIARGPQKAFLHPDYRIEAKSVDDVIAAVKFASMHNVRLTAIHSGHDGLGRYVSFTIIFQAAIKAYSIQTEMMHQVAS
jgi:hypothetical protein